MRILAITYCFVPLQFPATFRLLKWFSRLSELGHSVVVLCVHPETFLGSKDQSLTELVPNEVEIVYIPSPENSWLYRVLRKNENLLYPLFEPRKMEWFNSAKRRAHRFAGGDFDVILSCSQPAVCHLLGLRLSKAWRVPWVAFFSDPWVGNPFRGAESPRIAKRNARMESEVVFQSDAIMVTNEEHQAALTSRYGPIATLKTTVLQHCFKPDWYDWRMHAVSSRPSQDVRTVLLMGSFYGPRSLIPFLRVVGRLVRERRLGDRLSIRVYGAMSEIEQKDGAWQDADRVVRFEGRTDYLTSLALMKGSDALILLDAPTKEGERSPFFPSKLADYLGAQRPIVGFSPSAGVASEVLRRTGQVACDPTDEEAVRDTLLRLESDELDWAPQSETIQEFHYKHVGDRLARTLARVCATDAGSRSGAVSL